MVTHNDPTQAPVSAAFLDALAQSADTLEALEKIDQCRQLIVKDGIFSISQNATTNSDARDEIQLRRFYTSQAAAYPVSGTKRKTLTAWTRCLFADCRVFVGEGEEVLAQTFDDFETMRGLGARSAINVPLVAGRRCYATFNVFGTRDHWLPHEILNIRLLALAAAPWVPALPMLHYSLGDMRSDSSSRRDERHRAAQPS